MAVPFYKVHNNVCRALYRQILQYRDNAGESRPFLSAQLASVATRQQTTISELLERFIQLTAW